VAATFSTTSPPIATVELGSSVTGGISVVDREALILSHSDKAALPQREWPSMPTLSHALDQPHRDDYLALIHGYHFGSLQSILKTIQDEPPLLEEGLARSFRP
jgi:hypothetical protein